MVAINQKHSQISNRQSKYRDGGNAGAAPAQMSALGAPETPPARVELAESPSSSAGVTPEAMANAWNHTAVPKTKVVRTYVRQPSEAFSSV